MDLYIAMDRDRMQFLATGAWYDMANLSFIERQDSAVMIYPADNPRYEDLTEMELRLLYRNTTGQDFEGGVKGLIQACEQLWDKIPQCRASSASLERKAGKLEPVSEEVLSDPERSTRKQPVKIAPPPKEPPAKKSAAPSRPSAGSATGKVWAIADEVAEEIGGDDPKAWRAAVLSKCEEAGINKGTASTQFGKWKATRK